VATAALIESQLPCMGDTYLEIRGLQDLSRYAALFTADHKDSGKAIAKSFVIH
jgi:hypothetical protein